MLSVLQRRVPVVITFHGSDIWNPFIGIISLVSSYLSAWNFFISENLMKQGIGFRKRKSSIIPCGVTLNIFFPVERQEARNVMRLKGEEKLILFSGSFDNKIKNYTIAKKAIQRLDGIKLIELKGYSRKQVNYLMNACDVLLVTSYKESGPLVVKEALACNLPIVSTNVGDVEEVIGVTKGCYLAKYNPIDVAEKIKMALDFRKKTTSREKAKKYEINSIAERIKVIYCKVLHIENSTKEG